MRWLGACIHANEIATDYTCRRHAFGNPLINHEGVGFVLAENTIDLAQAETMVDWSASVLDSCGGLSTLHQNVRVAIPINSLKTLPTAVRAATIRSYGRTRR